MKQEITRIIITALVSTLIAILQTYLISITQTPLPNPSAAVAGLYGAVIASTRALTMKC